APGPRVGRGGDLEPVRPLRPLDGGNHHPRRARGQPEPVGGLGRGARLRSRRVRRGRRGAARRGGGLLGAPWGVAGAVLVGASAAAYLAREFGAPVPVPQLRRQVPDWWRTFFPPNVAAFLYGIGLGPGFLTYLSHG